MGKYRRSSGISSAAFMITVLAAPSLFAQAEAEPAVPAEEEAAAAPEEEAAAPAVDEERLKSLEEALAAQNEKIEDQEKELELLKAQTTAAEEKAAGAEEMATMVMTMDSEEAEVEEEKLRFYGFSDMAFKKIYQPETSRFVGLVDDNSSFAMGNVNLYIDAKPTDSIRVLTEVRFSLFPHGASGPADGTALTSVNNITFDTTSATGRNKVIHSSIVLERAWIDWAKYDEFKIRTGYFFTPYGIWNVDHGSPTLISSVLPSFWASEYFPTRQIGVQVLGEFFRGPMEYGYRAWVGNGRVDLSQMEMDEFKHYGGRLYAGYSGDVRAQVGASGFYGRQGIDQKQVVSYDPFHVESTRTEEFEEFGLAADASFDWGDFRFRGEFVMQGKYYKDAYRRASSPVTYQRDLHNYNGYVIGAYRLPWAGLEPFVYLEHASRPSAADNNLSLYSGGLIVHLDAGVQYKFQAFHVQFHDDEMFPHASESSFQGWDMRLVAAF